MSLPIKLPSSRQPVTTSDGNGQEVFTRPWFLFLQAVYERIGGAISPSTTDLAEDLFEDAGTSETNAVLFDLEKTVFQDPPSVSYIVPDNQSSVAVLTSLVKSLAAELAEIQKELNAIKQGRLI